MKTSCWLALAAVMLSFAELAAAQPSASPDPFAEPVLMSPRSAAGEAAIARIEQFRQDRLRAAHAVSLALPTFSLGSGEADLLLINRFGAPLDVEIITRTPQGRARVLTTVTVEPARHRRLAFAELMPAATERTRGGSLELRYMGDDKMLQAWAIAKELDQVVEMPFAPLGTPPVAPLLAFWDTRALPASASAAPTFWLTNFDAAPSRVTLTWSVDGAEPQTETRTLQPGEQSVFTPAVITGANDSSGWIRIVREETKQHVLVVGALRGVGSTCLLPLQPEPTNDRRDLRAIRIPAASTSGAGETRPMSAVATLFNPGPSARQVQLEILENPSGKPLASFEDTVAGGEVASFELLAMLESARPGTRPQSLGLRIRTEDGPILAQVVAFDAAGVAIDVPVFDVRDGHLSGAYPVVDPREGNTVATLLNVGDEPSRVGAQLSWSGGEYAAGPWEVAPGAMLTIDVAELVARQEADLLGRTPAAEEMTQGFLQWQALRGSLTLLGRTELHPAGSRDLAGFNCKLCCEMESFGQLSPGSVTFPVGAIAGFQATELISTCSGLNGPYVLSPAVLNYSSPMIWNGATIRSTGANHQIVSFEDEGVLTLPTCETFTPQIFDDGPATAFQVTIQTVDLPNDLIRIQLSSGQMSVDGQLRVTLRNAAGTDLRTIVTGSYGTGTHIFDFGDLATYPANTTYASVYATWTAAGQMKTASFPYVFTALGLYLHTCYNTPREAEFAATPTVLVGTTTGPNACVWGGTVYRRDFMTAVNRNGNGKTLANDGMQPEGSCQNAPATPPPYCAAGLCARYRVPTEIRTQCLVPPIVGQTVARNGANPMLRCADRVWIEGFGMRIVEDQGSFSNKQLDHYRGIGAAAGCDTWPNVDRPTFRLGR